MLPVEISMLIHVQTNSAYMAKWCFSLGIVSCHGTRAFIPHALKDVFLQSLKRIEVIEDDESEIIEAVRRMSDRYDLVVTRYEACHQTRCYRY